MSLATTPLRHIRVGDRVLSHTGMAGRVGGIFPAGSTTPTPSDDGVDRILLLWASGKWTLAPHASMDRIVHDLDPVSMSPGVARLANLAGDMKAILADMPPPYKAGSPA